MYLPAVVGGAVVGQGQLPVLHGASLALSDVDSKRWGASKKSILLWFAFYNFYRVHRTLRVTPAMEAGVADRLW